jgi:putative oxygen-independent coproporphyrinogen III oxidase
VSGTDQYPPLSLYVHLPWCIKKCPYCDFNSHATDNSSFPEQAYIAALIRDLDQEVPKVQGRKIHSIFIGGGTPSLFSAASLQTLLAAIRDRLSLAADIEITLEANPGTIEAARFEAYRDIGINRLSIGVQSFNDQMLVRLGRIHDAARAVDAIRIARSAGFELINIDLMYGLPGQSLAQALDDLNQGIEQATVHLSWYQLTIEPNTVFYKNPPVVPEEDQIWDIQQAGQQSLATAGLHQYEISAYSNPDKQCRHNLNYWQFGDYVGIGAGAHGKLTDPGVDGIFRYVRHRLPDRYIELAGLANVITETRQLHPADLILEYMMNALRLNDGFEHRDFSARTGLSLAVIRDQLEAAHTAGWLVTRDATTRPTPAGRNFLNDLLHCFMNDSYTVKVPEMRTLA